MENQHAQVIKHILSVYKENKLLNLRKKEKILAHSIDEAISQEQINNIRNFIEKEV
jgi:hypothetical protein